MDDSLLLLLLLLTNKIIYGFIGCLILFLFYGCQKDDLRLEQLNEPTPSHNLFNQSDFNGLIGYDYEVELENSKKSYSDDLESFYYEFPVLWTSQLNPEAINTLQEQGGYRTKYTVIAVETETDGFDFYAVKLMQYVKEKNIGPPLSEFTYGNLENFTGIVQLTDQNKALKVSKEYHSGKLTSEATVNATGDNDTTVAKRLKENCESRPVEVYTDWYRVYTIGSTTYIEYTHSVYEGSDYSHVCLSSGGGGGLPNINPSGPSGAGVYKKRNTGGSSAEDTIILIKDEVEDGIINNLTGKAECTYLKLKNNSILQKTIERFKGKTPINLIINQKSNLKIKDKNGKLVLVNGITNYGNSYNIEITLNTEQANNRPSLAVVRTILHEAIHAEIYRKVKTTSGISLINGEWKLPDGSRANFPSLFDAYNENPSNPYHNYMAKYYREALELGMKEYANSIGETHSDQFYKDLAWNGLLDTKAWKSQYADPVYANNEKTRIKNTIANYEKSKKNECQ